MTPKDLTWRLIVPLTIVSFGAVTKWWYVLPEDAPDTMMAGFPLSFVGDGWHTSMSLQILCAELCIDFIVYFLFWFLLINFSNRYLIKIKTPNILAGTLWTLSSILLTMAIAIACMPDQIIQGKRDWDMKVIVTGYKLVWKHQDRPDFDKAH